MSDAEYCFNEAIKEKRGMVNGSHHTKGKTKRNGTPRDLNVSNKEYNEKCGRVQKFSMSMPMTLEEFKLLPKDLQKEYIRRLVNTIGLTRKMISRMFGCSVEEVIDILQQNNINLPSKRGRRGLKVENLWRDFFSRDERFSKIMENFGHKRSEEHLLEEESKEKVVKTENNVPVIISSTIQITASGYSDIAEQLLHYADQDFPGNELIIKVIRK